MTKLHLSFHHLRFSFKKLAICSLMLNSAYNFSSDQLCSNKAENKVLPDPFVRM